MTKDGDRKADIRGKDGLFFRGPASGHVDPDGKIRRRDGAFSRGEEMGSVDADGNIRKKDVLIFPGEAVGQVKENRAHDLDRLIFSGEEWGYVDPEGNIRQKDGLFFKGRIIGHVKGNPTGALGFFVLKFFREVLEKVDALQADFDRSDSKGRFLGRVRGMLEWVPKVDALGDFDSAMKRLRAIEYECERDLKFNLSRKEALINTAANLSRSTDWKGAQERIRHLEQEWKKIGPAPQTEHESLWRRFRGHIDAWYAIRKEYFEKVNQEREANFAAKEGIIRQAKDLVGSTDWKSAGESAKRLQRSWKEIGAVPKERQNDQWARFRGVLDAFYQSRTEHFARLDREREANAKRKEAIIRKAEALSRTDNWRDAGDELEELKIEWKATGPVSKDQNDELWARFRAAQDRFHQRRKETRDRHQAEWQARMQEILGSKREQATRLRDSIEHDESTVDRWRDQIYSLRPGGRADEIRESLEAKIESVEDKVRSKEEKLASLETSIRDIEGKLR